MRANMSKKLLTACLLTIQLSTFSTAFAKSGGATAGGGGDVIIENGQLILRDFVLNSSSIEDIKENLTFINKYPEFSVLINKIGTVHPLFAMNILLELFNSKIYITSEALPILSKADTTIYGPSADVQIAVREGDDIIFAINDFNKVQNREYLFIHEALQGLIKGSGMFKHTRIRNIVRYLKENINNLNYDELNTFLKDNSIEFKLNERFDDFWYDNPISGKYYDPISGKMRTFQRTELFEVNVLNDLRASLISMYRLSDINRAKFANFLKIDISKFPSSSLEIYKFHERYINSILGVDKNSTFYLLDLASRFGKFEYNPNELKPIQLTYERIFLQKTLSKESLNNCRKNEIYLLTRDLVLDELKLEQRYFAKLAEIQNNSNTREREINLINELLSTHFYGQNEKIDLSDAITELPKRIDGRLNVYKVLENNKTICDNAMKGNK